MKINYCYFQSPVAIFIPTCFCSHIFIFKPPIFQLPLHYNPSHILPYIDHPKAFFLFTFPVFFKRDYTFSFFGYVKTVPPPLTVALLAVGSAITFQIGLTSMYVSQPLLANSPSCRSCFAVDTTNFTFPITSANLI